uniref:Origin recognition complex subunit 1 n=1 Tax=Anthurium amnicola TaxID=1678845 RepID=A0A1D1YNX4_9ARAE
MSVNGHSFVDWREHFISQERGSRVVHYYLEDSSGESLLAAVGTERSLRHMLYVVAEEFLEAIGMDKSGASCLKWRSRREVVDWLRSFLPKQMCTRDLPNSPTNVPLEGVNDPETYLNKNMDRFTRSLKGYNSDIVWSGVPLMCGKQLKHYQAFCRNGTTIATHSFVLVMSEEEENHYLAYLEDMYGDKKGQKKVKVRWFHQNQEVIGLIPPPTPHPREVFITPYTQVISAECVDDLATVLTPEHYDKCLASLPYACSAGIHLCSRQYNKNKFKPFDLSTLRGYFDQPILACLDIWATTREEENESVERTMVKCGSSKIRNFEGYLGFIADRLSVRPSGHATQITTSGPTYRNLRFGISERKALAVKFIGPRPRILQPFKIDEKVELLCQDSGIRGCWFRCTVLQLSLKRLKVRYDDLQDEDGYENLEEWVPAFRPAATCKLGMRCSGRLMIRPCRPHDNSAEIVVFEIGSAVDVWRNDGWWEGVVIGVNSCSDGGLQVYFPGEDVILNCHSRNLRIAKDWIKNCWVNIEVKPDIISMISAVSAGEKLSASSTFVKASESGGSAMSDQEAAVALKLNSNEEVAQTPASLSGGIAGPLESVKQVYSRKRHREDGESWEDGNRTSDGNSEDNGGIGC